MGELVWLYLPKYNMLQNPDWAVFNWACQNCQLNNEIKLLQHLQGLNTTSQIILLNQMLNRIKNYRHGVSEGLVDPESSPLLQT